MGFHMTCSTDMDSRVTCSKKYVELHVLHGFAIDSHMFAWVKHNVPTRHAHAQSHSKYCVCYSVPNTSVQPSTVLVQ